MKKRKTPKKARHTPTNKNFFLISNPPSIVRCLG
jgi:hypothetical protein